MTAPANVLGNLEGDVKAWRWDTRHKLFEITLDGLYDGRASDGHRVHLVPVDPVECRAMFDALQAESPRFGIVWDDQFGPRLLS